MGRDLKIVLFVLVFVFSGCYSCKSYHDFWGSGPVPGEVAEKFFFDSECRPIVVAAAPAPPPPKPKPRPVVRGTCGPYSATRDYPCSSCGVIRLEKKMPSTVTLNSRFDYTIKVTNLTDVMVTDVEVTERVAENFKYVSSNPSGEEEDEELIWEMESLGAGESREIKVTGMATSTDCLKHCAMVSYVVPMCANVEVVAPQLRLTKSAPAEVLLCDPIALKLEVTNTGTGTTEGVKVVDTLPAGLETTDGRRKIAFDAGSLASGQSRQFTAMVKATRTGKYVNKATASSADGLKAESAEVTTVVRQPVLTISKSGPERLYLGRRVNYEITVSNKGDTAARELVVEDRLPAGAQSVMASDGGRVSGGAVVWKLGSLGAGRSRTLSVSMMPGQIGTLTNRASAKATCAEGVSASTSTSVAGIPAVLLEVVDVEDPVEVGSNETYVITATNQGSADGTNIRIVCTLEDNVRYISSSGATAGSLQEDKVNFAALRRLAPKAKATWRVVVRAVKPGDVRFKVEMNTDQIERPVEETEATHLYE
jgi:uncharacterized repeat protein (TIGR01451 family)